ncbi:hypothetical protein GCM10010339_38130 [Streptomyces alanosinicus]|uniref:Uncharacterized protein n=1 Tax=Streptomyces alanosinicus TaxID=68171 RepID=A0A918YIZ5_9ACTN|nr:hypothetical protein GCM10010339_38130 [Streptomyces alanosinicus]
MHVGTDGDGVHGEPVIDVFTEFYEDRVEDLRANAGGTAPGATSGRRPGAFRLRVFGSGGSARWARVS